MDVVLWVIAGLLAVAFLGAGAMKLATPRAKLLENPQMQWASDFSEPMVKAIGAAEVLGAIGLVLPPLLGISPGLAPIAALCLAAVMGGAVATHVRRKEPFVVPLVLGVLSLLVGIGRLGPYPFG